MAQVLEGLQNSFAHFTVDFQARLDAAKRDNVIRADVLRGYQIALAPVAHGNEMLDEMDNQEDVDHAA